MSEWRGYGQHELILPRDAKDMITHAPLGESSRGRGWAKATPAKTIKAIIPKVDFIVGLRKECVFCFLTSSSQRGERGNWVLLQKKPSSYIVLSYEFLGLDIPPTDPIPETVRSQSRHMTCMTV